MICSDTNVQQIDYRCDLSNHHEHSVWESQQFQRCCLVIVWKSHFHSSTFHIFLFVKVLQGSSLVSMTPSWCIMWTAVLVLVCSTPSIQPQAMHLKPRESPTASLSYTRHLCDLLTCSDVCAQTTGPTGGEREGGSERRDGSWQQQQRFSNGIVYGDGVCERQREGEKEKERERRW